MSDRIRRFGQVIRIKPEHGADYEALHADPWPEVLNALSESEIRNYSIYRHDDLLFSYFEYHGSDFESDMQHLAENEYIKRWWAVCMPMQEPLDGRDDGEWWLTLQEIFHHD